MNPPPIHLLFIEDNPADARLICGMLARARRRFRVECSSSLSAGRDKLAAGDFDAILLDLQLPDSRGLNTFRAVQSAAPGLPIIVLTGLADEALALEAVHEGAQDYLSKHEVDAALLERSVLYAIERARAEAALAERTAAATRSQQALREQTRILQSVMQSMVDAVVVVDRGGEFLMFNPAAAELCGYPPGEARKELRPADRVRVFRSDRQTPFPVEERPLTRARQGETVRDEEAYLVPATASEGTLVSVNATPLHDDSGAVCGGVAILRDVTQRRAAEEAVRQLNAELEQRVEERTQDLAAAYAELEAFSYSVSHDLRAPLRTIDAFSLAVGEDYADRLDARGRDYLRRVRAAAGQMETLIAALLDLARVSRTELHRRAIDLSQLARRIADDLCASDPQRQVEWTIASGLQAEGDPRLVRILLENLLGNAWKFTARTCPARIEFASAGENGQVVYVVRDNGVGFDMGQADRLFVPFQRLHRQSEFEGLGIGLATVRRIVARHGGQVGAASQSGHGAIFRFTLASQELHCDSLVDRASDKAWLGSRLQPENAARDRLARGPVPIVSTLADSPPS